MLQLTSIIDGLGIDLAPEDKREFLHLIDKGLSHVEDLSNLKDKRVGSRHITMALSGAIQSANALLGSAAAKCNLATPPEEIEVTQDTSGALILRCFHDPVHSWGWD